MNFHVELSEKAHRDLDQILAWFYDNRALAAGRRWERSLRATLRKLAREPTRYPLAPELESLGVPVRELHLGKRPSDYRVYFQVENFQVTILHIRHSARDELSLEDLS